MCTNASKKSFVAAVEKLNAWTVGLAGGQLEGAPIKVATLYYAQAWLEAHGSRDTLWIDLAFVAACIVAAFAMSALLQLGILDVTGGLIICASVTGIGVVLYARTDVAAIEAKAAARRPEGVGAPVAPGRPASV